MADEGEGEALERRGEGGARDEAGGEGNAKRSEELRLVVEGGHHGHCPTQPLRTHVLTPVLTVVHAMGAPAAKTKGRRGLAQQACGGGG